ncbi:MAG: hypothetical protein WAP23_01280, partial [Candidatus Spechtbacterales bacterium]
AMSPDVYVEDLDRRTESNGIQWTSLGDDFCEKHRAIVDGAEIHICAGPVMGLGNETIFLTCLVNGRRETIVEPQIHISQAPIGKFLRGICRFFGWEEFPRGPQTPEDREKERLRIALNRLHLAVQKQCDPYVGQPIYEAPVDRLLRKVTKFFGPPPPKD